MQVRCSFNPRAHAGRDSYTGKLKVIEDVSIHAPTRGATKSFVDDMNDTQFQSTRPRGARLALVYPESYTSCFNPRAHAGRDKATQFKKGITTVSIHAPTRGATADLSDSIIHDVFQSTRPRGARPSPVFS